MRVYDTLKIKEIQSEKIQPWQTISFGIYFKKLIVKHLNYMASKPKHQFIQLFRQIQTKFSRLYARRLMEKNLTLPQFTLLSLLLESGPLPMSETGTKLHISKPAVTHLTDQLEKKHYLIRQAEAGDRRVTILKILPRGAKKAEETRSEFLKILLKTLDQFSDEEQKMIVRFYEKLMVTVENSLVSGRNP